MMHPPWDEGRVLREFEAIRKRDVESNGPFPAASPAGSGTGPSESLPPKLSDDALAAVFVARHGAETRHVTAFRSWYVWSGKVWRYDETGLTRERMRQVCREAAAGASGPHDARRIASDKAMAAGLRVASSDPFIAARSSDWDSHPMLLNTPAGVIDLETGEVMPHDPDLKLTQITTASPGTDCPLWTDFLTAVTDGDGELQAYLQRLAGYCLTGATTEQVFAFLHGAGGNGKSVFLQTIASVLGTYAATAALDTFMASRSNRHLTELAGLRAARLVIVSETEAGKSWSEARIKTVTGGENIRANFMRCDHFEFTPRFKLVVMGNHRPAIASVGESMRRRLHLVPFSVTIPENKQDGRLRDKLFAERDGILGWMLSGCAEWLKSGLKPPARVMEAAKDYFASEDVVGQWISERCNLRPALKTLSSELYGSWKVFAEANGHAPGSAKSLGDALRSRGLSGGKLGRGRGWIGIGLARPGAAEEVAE